MCVKNLKVHIQSLIHALKHIGHVFFLKYVQQYFRVMHLEYIFDVIQTIPFKTNRISK